MSYAGGTIIKSHMLITLGLCPMAADLAFTPDLAELWMSCKIQSISRAPYSGPHTNVKHRELFFLHSNNDATEPDASSLHLPICQQICRLSGSKCT